MSNVMSPASGDDASAGSGGPDAAGLAEVVKVVLGGVPAVYVLTGSLPTTAIAAGAAVALVAVYRLRRPQ